MDVATFRADFPEFGDSQTYPDSVVNYWLTVAGNMLISTTWGNMLNLGLELFTAHNIVIEARSMKNAAIGGMPGESKGPVSAKAVDKVSMSYDTQAAIEKDAGHWNLTIYGTRFIRLAKMLGAGGLQITGC